MSKNPYWTNDDHILALDLYFTNDGRLLKSTDKKLIELSNLLISLPILSDKIRMENFRNISGVSIKLGNFRRLDPDLKRVGLPHGAKGEACSFDSKDKYGELGEGFAECHHTILVFRLKDNQKTTLSDLSILCANCHGMIHQGNQCFWFLNLKTNLKLN
jgi:Zn finger protein HypA/HybF involved in hydrogenase expression